MKKEARIKKFVVLAAITVLCGVPGVPTLVHGQSKAQAPASKLRRSANAIPNRYIVVLEESAAGPKGELSLISTVAADIAHANGGTVKHLYTHAIQGFSVEMSEHAAISLANTDPRIKYIEQDGEIFATQAQTDATWGLDRIDQRDRPLNTTYTYTATGAGVNVYVIDSGIRPTHQEFGGRAAIALDVVGDGREGLDCTGHGTHVAGTIGGSSYGVAKEVNLYALRVFDCEGRSSWSGTIEAVDWVTANHTRPAVANMSLGGRGSSQALEEAVQNSIAAGVTYVIAAGNSSEDACNFTPARVPEAITVGATDFLDWRSSFSNWGTCVDIFAPGSDITSAWWTGDTATNTIDGTSMAAPHVAGVAALYLQNNPGASPAAVTSQILGTATSGRLSSIGAGSPNLLLYSLLTGSSAPCTECEHYSGYLSGSGAFEFQPNGEYYTSSSFWYHRGWLRGPAGTDFDLYLLWWDGSSWVTIASSEGPTSEEEISFLGLPGSYVWRVYSYSGGGSYDFWMQRP